jgi:hypothetical protein
VKPTIKHDEKEINRKKIHEQLAILSIKKFKRLRKFLETTMVVKDFQF